MERGEGRPRGAGKGNGMSEVVLQRVVFPWGIELPATMHEIQPLYVTPDGMTRKGSELGPAVRSGTAASSYVVTGRRSLEISAYGRASFDTYFNRVHAGYLNRWTNVKKMTLRMSGSGDARITVKHSTPDGIQVTDTVATANLKNGFSATLPLSPFLAGGAQWFEVEALGEPVEVVDAEWVSEGADPVDAVIDVAICTFNRPGDTLSLLTTLRADPEFLAHVGTVWVVDNGTQSFTDEEGAAAVIADWGDRLQVVHQPNLGGSGGFSRGMYESSRKGTADYVFLMDDDVLAEPESLRRALVFAEIATVPLAVGGQMLVRGKPLELHSSGERVDARTFKWGAAPLGEESIAVDKTALDHVVDVGYNGWWACLIPLQAIREIGLAQPFFIKWDDAEYGMRLAQHGYRTVSLPGVAVWHESWELKDDTVDWTLYFHLRNRLIAAAMLSEDVPERVMKKRFQSIVKDIIVNNTVANISRRAYSSADAANKAMQDFLRGPEILYEPLDELVAEVRAERTRVPGDQAVPPYDPSRQPASSGPAHARSGLVRAMVRELGGPRLILPIPVPRSWREKPTADEWDIWRSPVDRGPVPLRKEQDTWRYLMDNPDAVVVTADGTKAVVRRRDVPVARALLKDNLRLAREIMQQASALVPQYAAVRDRVARPEAWEKQWTR